MLTHRQLGARGDNSTDDTNALAAAFKNPIVTIPQGTYQTAASIRAVGHLQKVVGQGWQRQVSGELTGTIIKSASPEIEDLLTIQSEAPERGRSTDIQGARLEDFGLLHHGAGSGLTIDNVVRPRVRNIYIDCDGKGAIGMTLANWSFFAVLDELVIVGFTEKGLVVGGVGSQHVIRNSHIASGSRSGKLTGVALEMHRFDFNIDGGQSQRRPTGQVRHRNTRQQC